jgi:cytochrome c oxidase subunit IV
VVTAVKARGMGSTVVVYFCILVIAALQFLTAFANISPYQMLTRMLILAAIEAIMGVLFFMHLWYENRTFLWSVVIITVFVLTMMQVSWFDSFRLLKCGGYCS